MSLSIGITCYPTFGGSGVLATQLGMQLAHRGHRVHFICSELPCQLDPALENVWFHRVEARDYPVFPHVPFALALSSAMVDIGRRHGLDLLHVHYAVPHATSAWMAREIEPRLKVVTTLHGTDITLVGSDASYLPITRHSILQSDAVTVPSAALARETRERFDLDTPLEVIPNFVDTDTFRPASEPGTPVLTELFGGPPGEPVLVHVSNFRRVKRVDRVVDVLARVSGCRLLLVGDGPERPAVERQVDALGLRDRVCFAGTAPVESLLRECAVFVLPSDTESFGLAALEALASGIPVVASDVGGLPEVVQHGQTGFLAPVGDLDTMASQVQRLVDDASLRRELGQAARADVLARFRAQPLVDAYEAVYRQVLGEPQRP